MTTPITAIAIAIPARDERDTIRACLRAITASAQALPPTVAWSLCVVADRCTDDTAALARSELDGHPALVVVNDRDRPLGEVRDLGLRHAREHLGPHTPAATWLLSTDADTTVPDPWLTDHLRLANSGTHATAGMAHLDGLPRAAILDYARVLDLARIPEGHGNIYGANLGIRADAYDTVGGFGPINTGEDHHIWHRLGHTGHHRTYAEHITVTTSARTQGRATGGLADLLATLPA
ncbi:glycosyltransferase [Actinokineospora diospyrosa]|uniref:Glycosyltransferase like family 2 n=1 Tax=Actinokineospora diospyrosa TaxID=103728 RepID=A0ABT1IC47_9PSEU|nr:glycosyltransferase [Actinokineospora diospyrosa]MCP2270209.1 Glycosyltransferase like family 2 [Actinokineospora diospyrosa]